MINWLVTWESAGSHAHRDDRIVTILSGRFSGERIRELVELLYVNAAFDLHGRLAYAKRSSNTPYPARFVTAEGIQQVDRVHCGHNPYLYARKVRNLRVELNGAGEEQLVWDEFPPLNMREILKRMGRWR